MIFIRAARSALTAAFVVATVAGCSAPPEPRRTGFRVERESATAEYDDKTGRLRRLEVDTTRDGRIDTVSFMDGTRVERIEIDRSGDGIVDRWEYYDDGATMVRVGTSSRGDGVVDTWSYPAPGGDYAIRIEVDTTRDGRVDKWEHYDAPPAPAGVPILRVVELDVEGAGRPTRRLHYNADGSFSRVEQVP